MISIKKVLTLTFIILSIFSFAQTDNREAAKEIVDKIKQNYIEERAFKIIDSLFEKEIQSGDFKDVSEKEFAEMLTQKLRSVVKDKHFFVKYLENYTSEKNPLSEKEREKVNNIQNSLENFGFEKVERLAGNIGYINYKGFAEPKSSEKALESAMNFVENTNSLIIDLRENGGGDNGMLLLFCSYLFGHKTHLYNTYFRNKNKTIENFTKSNVSGEKYLNRAIYILTSEKTFSAGEALAYFLQERKLAAIIGEKTGGAANPVDAFFIQDKYMLLVPTGKIISAVSGKNWEHTGVMPDISVKADNALKTAYSLALKRILNEKTKTELSETEIKNLIIKLE